MARAELEREARRAGDVDRSRLAPAAGALLGGGIAIELGGAGMATRLSAFARVAFRADGDAGGALREVLGLVGSVAGPVLGGAALGALALGVLQTRGHAGRPDAPEPPERAAPGLGLALGGWVALLVLALDGARGALGLLAGGAGIAVGAAAATLARNLGRAFLGGVVLIAAVDHLARARARRARLEAGTAGRRAAAPPAPEAPPVEALLTGVERVLYDEDVAVTFGRREGAWWGFARARGLPARALVDAARRARIAVRPSGSRAALEALVLGAPVEAPMVQALRLEVSV